MTSGAGVLLWQQQRRQLTQEISTLTAMVNRDFQVDLANQAAALSMALQPIAADVTVQRALQEADTDRLLAAWAPLFKTLHNNNGLTHFYFLDQHRVCLLRVHKPERRGDLINRFTALEAERTGKTASGIELGPLGTFTLRVVQPVFSPAGTLVGYVELGKEIEDVLRLRQTNGLELAVLISKQHLSRQRFEEGQHFLQREADWDQLSHSIVIYASQGRLPDAFAPIVDDPDGRLHPDRDIISDGKDWRVSTIALHDASGQAVGTFLVMKDITPENEAFARLLVLGGMTGGILMALLLGFIVVLLRRTDAQIDAQRKDLLDSLQFQRDLIDAVPSPIFYKDAQGVYLGSNSAFERYLGLSSEQLIGKTVYELSPADLAEKYDQADRALLNNPGVQTYEAQVVYADGSRHDVIFNKATFANTAGQVAGLIGVMMDISERKQAEEKLHLAASVFTYAHEGILITTADGTIIDVNHAFSRITGYSRDEVLGQNPRLLSSGRHDKAFYAAMWRNLIDKGHWYGEIWNRRKNGSLFAEMQTISNVCDARGNTRQYVALFSDITVLKEHESQLEHIAHYDALTTLPNRVLLADRLQHAMAQAQRRQQPLAVAFIDLDGFKAINDHHGHEAGDLLLIAVATRMNESLRKGDTLARIGGDEFVAVLVDLTEITASVPMLSRLLDAAAQPVHAGDALLQVSASAGVTFYPQAQEINADQLFRQADQAMYQAKLAGKNRYHVFDAELDSSVRDHHQSLERIRDALTAGEFVLHYQPKVNLRSGTVVGAEALIRWQHPDSGLLPPAAFLPVIEDDLLAIDVGEWVIDMALTQMERWRDAGLDIPVSVNVAARQLQHADFSLHLRALLAAHPGIKPWSLQLEILESSALEDLARVSRIIRACGQIGVHFALDDFGTGYSSLTYLKRLPVAMLKIDQSFVRDMLDDPDDLAILEGVIGLARAFHRQVIAEGVETVEHGEMLLQLGCELAQGYGIARPMPADELPAWSAAWRPDPAWMNLSPVSRDDLPLLFAMIEHRAWIHAIENYLEGVSETLPLDHRSCRFGAWLETGGPARQGMRTAFDDLEPLHRQVHELAEGLLELQAAGRNSEALLQLAELHDLRNDFLQRLKALVRGNGQQAAKGAA
ncbi:MAG: EAL domain-containing protein [Candidatus Accumulibacter sp. UW20]